LCHNIFVAKEGNGGGDQGGSVIKVQKENLTLSEIFSERVFYFLRGGEGCHR
jgi:hypothetical protein